MEGQPKLFFTMDRLEEDIPPDDQVVLRDGLNYRVITSDVLTVTSAMKVVLSNGYGYRVTGRSVQTNPVEWLLECKEPSCYATAIVRNGTMIERPGANFSHTCERLGDGACDLMNFREFLLNVMRRRAAREGSTLKHIYDLEVQGQPDGFERVLSFTTAERAMTEARADTSQIPPHEALPSLIESLEYRRHPPLYQDLFLGHVKEVIGGGSLPRPNEYGLVFVNRTVLDEVCGHSTSFAMDDSSIATLRIGTIATGFPCNILNITAECQGKMVVVFVGLVTARLPSIYQKIFKLIRESIPHLKINEMTSKYDLLLTTAFKDSFPAADLRGCWMDYCKAVFAKMETLKLGGFFRAGGGGFFPAGGSGFTGSLSHLLKRYLLIPLLRPDDIWTELENIKKMIKVIGDEHCGHEEQRGINGVHNFVVTKFMMKFGPEMVSVLETTQPFQTLTERLNVSLARLIRPDDSVLFFMNRIRTYLFESPFSIRVGRQEKFKETIVFQSVCDRSSETIKKYRDGICSGYELLATLAHIFEDIRVIDMLAKVKDCNVGENGEGTLQADERVIDFMFDEESSAVTSSRMGTEGAPGRWMIEDLFPEEGSEATATPEKRPQTPTTEAEVVHLLRKFEITDLVVPVCSICLEGHEWFVVLKPCRHVVCQSCFKTINVNCPFCRALLANSTKPEDLHDQSFNVGGIQYAWKSNVKSDFGNKFVVDPDLDGNRRGDLSEGDESEIMSFGLASEDGEVPELIELSDREEPEDNGDNREAPEDDGDNREEPNNN